MNDSCPRWSCQVQLWRRPSQHWWTAALPTLPSWRRLLRDVAPTKPLGRTGVNCCLLSQKLLASLVGQSKTRCKLMTQPMTSTCNLTSQLSCSPSLNAQPITPRHNRTPGGELARRGASLWPPTRRPHHPWRPQWTVAPDLRLDRPTEDKLHAFEPLECLRLEVKQK